MNILSTIKDSIITGKWNFSDHVIKRCDERDIDIEKLLFSIVQSELLEDYSDDPRGHSCLLLSYIDGKPVHTVCGILENHAVFITVYWPEEPKWINERTRSDRK